MELIEAYKYCPRCGHDFEKKTSHLQCPNCGLSFYINPKPCVAAVFKNSKGEFLVVKRAVEPGKGKYDLPGGFVEEHETFEEAIRREIKEELGFDMGEVTYLGSSNDPYVYQDLAYRTLSVWFFAELPDDIELKAADDIYDPAFFKAEDIPYQDFLITGMVDALKRAIDYSP